MAILQWPAPPASAGWPFRKTAKFIKIMKERKFVYICCAEENGSVLTERFKEMFRRLIWADQIPVNSYLEPLADLDTSILTPYQIAKCKEYYILKRIDCIGTCDVILLADGWRQSHVCLAAYHIAIAMGKEIWYENERDAREHLTYEFVAKYYPDSYPLNSKQKGELDDYIAKGLCRIHSFLKEK